MYLAKIFLRVFATLTTKAHHDIQNKRKKARYSLQYRLKLTSKDYKRKNIS